MKRAVSSIHRDDFVDAAPLLAAAGRLVAVEDQAIAGLDRCGHLEPDTPARQRFHNTQRDASLLGVIATHQDFVVVAVQETVREPA